jgi:inhibitor of KinA sporulation pathway (predicted exonuclease)
MIRTDRLLCIDLEATCWEGQAPDGQFSEIIDVGICIVDTQKMSLMNTGTSLIVRPRHSTVSPFCTQLTGYQQSDVEKGMSLQEACNILRKEYLSRDYAWCSYGDYDRKMFLRECTNKNVPYPFSDTHINAKAAVNFLIPQRTTSIGLQDTVKALGVHWEGRAHKGSIDALHLARVMIELARRSRVYEEEEGC